MHHIREMDTKSQADDSILAEITRGCLLTRTRRLSRLVTNTYDQALRPFGVNAPQFSLLVLISKFGPASRAEIGRINYQDRSTLTRNLALLLAEGWVEELKTDGGRSRPIEISRKGRQLLASAAPAWRQAQAEARDLIGDDAADNILRVVDAISLDRLKD
jgi:DNA-binding MarR family transcriptional regulator